MYLLKTQGPSDSQNLAARLGVSAMAVRQHLYALRSQKIVTYKQERRPYGRPAKVWRLLHAADCFFPDGHARLSMRAIDAVRSAFGPKGFNRWVAEVTQMQMTAFEKQMPEAASFQERLKVLAETQTAQGYLVELQSTEEGVFLLVENHCPIRTAAAACDRLCSIEQRAFQNVLGPGIRVQRLEHILAGDRHCVYLFRKKN